MAKFGPSSPGVSTAWDEIKIQVERKGEAFLNKILGQVRRFSDESENAGGLGETRDSSVEAESTEAR